MATFVVLVNLVGVVRPIILYPFVKLVGLAKKHATTIQRCDITINCIGERAIGKS